METICIKVDKELARAIEEYMKKKHYNTKTEFFRQAIREKMSELELEEAFKAIEKFRKNNPRRTTDADLRRVREELAKELEKEMSQED